MLKDEVVPRGAVPIGAGAGERQILEMQPREIPLDVAGTGGLVAEGPIGAGLEGRSEARRRHAPSRRVRAFVEA